VTITGHFEQRRFPILVAEAEAKKVELGRKPFAPNKEEGLCTRTNFSSDRRVLERLEGWK
jgi:hypothetical protein